jgi:hypothetical protein
MPLFTYDEFDCLFKSGTCVGIEISARCFLLTAGHNLREEHQQAKRFLLPTREPDDRTIKVYGQSIAGWRFHDPLDLAWLEVHPKLLPGQGRRWLSIESAATSWSPTNGEHVFVSGGVETKEGPKLNGMPGHVVSGITYATCVVTSPEIPENARPYDPTIDVFIEYDQDAKPPSPPGWWEQAPNPSGLSGGGIFLRPPKNELWHPGKVRLGALVTESYARGKWLRGLRIDRALDVVLRESGLALT